MKCADKPNAEDSGQAHFIPSYLLQPRSPPWFRVQEKESRHCMIIHQKFSLPCNEGRVQCVIWRNWQWWSSKLGFQLTGVPRCIGLPALPIESTQIKSWTGGPDSPMRNHLEGWLELGDRWTVDDTGAPRSTNFFRWMGRGRIWDKRRSSINYHVVLGRNADFCAYHSILERIQNWECLY